MQQQDQRRHPEGGQPACPRGVMRDPPAARGRAGCFAWCRPRCGRSETPRRLFRQLLPALLYLSIPAVARRRPTSSLPGVVAVHRLEAERLHRLVADDAPLSFQTRRNRWRRRIASSYSEWSAQEIGMSVPAALQVSVIVTAQVSKSRETAIGVDRQAEHDRPAAHLAVLDRLLVPARGINVGLERFPAGGTLHGLRFEHGVSVAGA